MPVTDRPRRTLVVAEPALPPGRAINREGLRHAWQSVRSMEDLVAVAVDFTEVGTRYFIVYGRIFGAVEDEAIEAVVLKAAQRSDYGGIPLTATVCRTLHEASSQPYFYEALFDMTRDAVSPGTRRYERWRKRVARSMKDGREIWFLGHPE